MASEINGLPPSAAPLPGRLEERSALKPADGRSGSDSPAATRGKDEAAPDTVRLTDMATRLQALEARLAQMSEVDTQRVEAVRRALAEGSYPIRPERLAEKLLAFERALGIYFGP